MDGQHSWTKHAYPVQSYSTDPLPETEHNINEEPPSYQLPRDIPAVKDAEAPQKSGRTIVLCLDGTGDKFDDDNSNIVHLVSCLKKDDHSQTTYYQAGIGTYSSGGLQSGVSAAMDMAVGSGLGLHVRDAYHFLMHSYKEGDRICIFGFSRGAYTARCVAGMVHKVGLLPPRNIAQIPFAYDIYKDDTPQGWSMSADFKKTFCINVNVYFLGVFDSVASVGFIPRQLPLSSTPWSKSRYFRHAMALDERRSKFKVARFQTKAWEQIGDDSTTSQPNNSPSPTTAMSTSIAMSGNPTSKLRSRNRRKADAEAATAAAETLKIKYEKEVGQIKPYETDTLEVWFAGCHADIGGGAVANDERHKLAQIPLRWMIRQAFDCNTGIIFNTRALAEIGLDVHTLWPKYTPLTVPILAPAPSILEQYQEGLPPRSRRSSKLVARKRDDKHHEHHDHHGSNDDGEFYHLEISEAERHGAPIEHAHKRNGWTKGFGNSSEANGVNNSTLVKEDEEDGEEDGEEEADATSTSALLPAEERKSKMRKFQKEHDWLPEQVEDYFDAMTTINDQLAAAWSWWILEFWPVQYKVQQSNSDDWDVRFGMNLGRYRAVEDLEPNIHWTVRRRIDDSDYKVLARFGRNAMWKLVA